MMPADVDFPSDLRALESEYELIRELGQGGMAAVYLARQRATGRLVAIKAIRARYLDDADALRRFAREARTVAELDHPNIVRTEAIEQIGDRAVAIIMEHVPGGTLRDRLREFGSLGAEEAEGILRDVGSALGYAHRHGIVHRDVKPENIFLDPTRRRALLSDFGIARKIDTDAGITLLGAALGTPQYMSPEQIDGEQVDGRSDIYSLGVLGWELLTGRRPWAGESLYGVIYKQKHEDLPRITSVRPRVPANLLFAIEGALIKDKEQRWQSIDEFLDRLTYSPPPLLSQTYPPGAGRPDNQPTIRFRPVELQEPSPVPDDAVAASADVREMATPVETPAFTGPVESFDDVAVVPALIRAERYDALEPAFPDSGYVLPEFVPNADTAVFPTARARVARALGLVVPLGIAAAAAFIVLGGSANRSTPRASKPNVTASAGQVGLDSTPHRAVAAVPTVPDTAAEVADSIEDPADNLSGVGAEPSGPLAATVRRPARKPPVFVSARSGGSTTATSPAAGAAHPVRADTSRGVASDRPPDAPSDPTPAGSKPEAARDSRSATETIEDPFKIPAAASSESPPALGAPGAVPSPRCRLAATADQQACLSAYIAVGDMPLNNAFDALVSEMRRVAQTGPGAPDPPTVQRIRVEQRAWLSIRDSECPRSAPPGAGPFWAAVQSACFAEMAEARTAELKDAVKRLKRR
jgi:serine/threonine protein kinase/uncharacterized protein YecT (DUF1311 family)